MTDKNIKLGISLGVLGLGGLKSIFGQTRREVETLKGSTDTLTRASKAAGTAQVSFATQGRAALAKLKGSYEGLTASLGGLRMAAMALAAVPVTMGLNKALELQDVSIDLAMGMGLDASAENDLAALIQSASSSGIQTHAQTGSAAQALVAGGVRDLEALGEYLPILTKAATATRAGMQELTGASLALRDNLGLDAEGFERSMNMLSHASNTGKMGVDGMISSLPGLSLRMKELGVTGDAAVAEIAAALQTARESAVSDSEAAANVDKFLDRITSDAARKRFESAGIVLKKSIENLTAKGWTPMEAMLDTVTQYVGSKGPQALKAFNSALSMDEGKAREEAFATLSARYALGDLFMDSGIQNFASAAMRNRDRFQGMKQDNLAAANDDLIGEDFIRRSRSGKVQLQKLRIELSNIGATLGGPLASALVSITQSLLPVINSFAQWAQDNPGMVKALLITAGGFAGLRLGIAGVGALMRSGTAIFGVFKGAALGLARVFPILKGGFMLAGKALLWLGRALLMNPIGLLVTGIGVAAFFIYKYWEPISAFFSGLWDSVKAIFSAAWDGITGIFSRVWETIATAFDGGIAGISALIVDWSPLGLFYKGFAAVMDWFGVELPDSFSEFGSMLIDGLIGGITGAFGKAKDAIVGLGKGIAGWFGTELEIHSPSRVFMQLGGFVSEGAALGIREQMPQAGEAVAQLSGTVMDGASEWRAAPPVRERAPAVNVAAPSSSQIQFSPVINITAAPGESVEKQVQRGMRLSMDEFRRMYRELQYQDRRTDFAGVPF